MNKYRAFVTLLITILVLISLGTSTGQVKAYGNSIITVNCPVFTISATSDHPLTFAGIGQNYIVAYLLNLTTGDSATGIILPIRSEVIFTGRSTAYIRYYYERSINVNAFRLILSPGDQYSYAFFDLTGPVGSIKGVCTSPTVTRNSYPAGYILKTIICSSDIFSSPGGPVLPPYPHSTDVMPELDKQRYVLPVGATGPDGQLYDKIQRDAVTFGYFPRRCLG